MSRFKPYYDDEGNRKFKLKRRINEKGDKEVYDIKVLEERVLRDGKHQSKLFMFALTEKERKDLIKALEGDKVDS
jgi:hypothetical protein